MITHWPVHNVKCDACARRIHRRLKVIGGVSNIEVAVSSGVVTFDADPVLWPEVAQTLAKLGYVRKEDNPNNTPIAAARSVVSCLLGRVQSEDE